MTRRSTERLQSTLNAALTILVFTASSSAMMTQPQSQTKHQREQRAHGSQTFPTTPPLSGSVIEALRRLSTAKEAKATLNGRCMSIVETSGADEPLRRRVRIADRARQQGHQSPVPSKGRVKTGDT